MMYERNAIHCDKRNINDITGIYKTDKEGKYGVMWIFYYCRLQESDYTTVGAWKQRE